MINLNSNYSLRTLIVLLDYITMCTMFVIYHEYGKYDIYVPYVYMMVGIIAFTIAEMVFPTRLHLHHQGFDKELKQVVSLSILFGISFFLLCSINKWTYFRIIAGLGTLDVSIGVSVALLLVRTFDFLCIKLIRKKGRNVHSILFAGEIDTVRELLRETQDAVSEGFAYKGYYSTHNDEQLSSTVPYLGDYEQIAKDIQEKGHIADEFFCSIPFGNNVDSQLHVKLMTYCMHNTIRFFFVPPFLSDFGNTLVPHMLGTQIVFTNIATPLLNPANRMQKRLFDIIVSASLLILILPLAPIIALIIKLQSPGPIFFGQKRTGMNDKEFICYKFRSMHVNKDADKMQATKDDPRKFPFGNLIRKTNIDELPQFYNVLKGDMSIVGPRPHMLLHTDQYRKQIESYMLRHYVRPGITGWAQTTGYRGETKELWQMEGRVKRDLWYIQNWSLWLDLRIIFKTIKTIIFPDKAAY
ncbi:MAG: exopolysaccharide biosynthesis polyprenyl glycosylphosphotransferase [Bacteroidaceae bacterium]|nr:exopolysaccharide biosynthesis polyprenyl glycosylphosphotransferase [Bacteroidaceae bacterium]